MIADMWSKALPHPEAESTASLVSGAVVLPRLLVLHFSLFNNSKRITPITTTITITIKTTITTTTISAVVVVVAVIVVLNF